MTRPSPAGPTALATQTFNSIATDAPIFALGLPVLAHDAAYRAGIHTVGQLAAMTDQQLLAHKEIDERICRELRAGLAQFARSDSGPAGHSAAWVSPTVKQAMQRRDVVECPSPRTSAPPSVAAPQPVTPPADAAPPILQAAVATRSDTLIDALGLSVRAYNAVARAGIETVEQLAALGPSGVMAIRSVGILIAEEIATKLASYGLPLSASAPDKAVSGPAPTADEALVGSLRNVQSPLKGLDLSIRTYNALTRAGIRTIGKLATLSHDDLAHIRNVGPTTIAEIETQLAAYQSQPSGSDAPGHTSHSPPDDTHPLLYAISVARLGLPSALNAQLAAAGLQMIGQVVADVARHSHPPAVREAAADYLVWWAEQTPAARAAEVTDTGPSRMCAWRATSAGAVTCWLPWLDDRQRQIIRLRFGLDGPALTLEEVGQRLDVTRERVRQIEQKTLARLRLRYTTGADPLLAAFAVLVRHELLVHEHGWPLEECAAWLRSNDETRLGPIEPLGVLGLLCAVDEQFVLWPKHGVIALAGVLPGRPPQRRARPKVATPGATEPGPNSPRYAREPADKAPASPQRLAAWPNLWPDKWRDHGTFMQFVAYANERLADRPTVAAWTADLLTWAHRSPNRSAASRQTVLDAAYIVGLIERVSYNEQATQVLEQCLPAQASPVELRNHCIHATLDRLEKAPVLLRAITSRASFNFEMVQAALTLDEATAVGHFQLFRLLGLVDGRGPIYTAAPLAASFRNQTKITAGKAKALPRRTRRQQETQRDLLLRALQALGRPAHVSEILSRAASLKSAARVPKQSSAILLLLQADERAVISLGEGVFSLTEWEAARARETRPTLAVCPRPWVEVAVFHNRLLESVVAAHQRLGHEPTVDEFVADMLAWWGVDTGARLWVRQSLISAYYLLGVTPNYVFAGDGAARLQAEALPAGVATTRDHCRQALSRRLAAMPDCLALLQQLGPLRPKTLAEAFVPRHPYSLNDVEARLHMLVGLGAAERLPVGTYRLSAAGADRATAGPSARLRACPALLPDRPGEGHTFLESVARAGEVLAEGPTVEQFLRQMIVWAGSDYPKSETYYQNVLDAYYVVGLIERTRYKGQEQNTLRSSLPPTADVQALRDRCIRAALDRLEHGRRLLEAAEQLQPFTRRQMQKELDIDVYNAARHIRLFENLGLFSQEGSRFGLTTIGFQHLSASSTSYTIQLPERKVKELNPRLWSEDGLELLAYLGGVE